MEPTLRDIPPPRDPRAIQPRTWGWGILLALLLAPCLWLLAPKPPRLLPEVRTFIRGHAEYGRPTDSEAVPDWARGERQRVRFSTGRSLLFYTEGGQVASVYEDDPLEGRRRIWPP